MKSSRKEGMKGFLKAGSHLVGIDAVEFEGTQLKITVKDINGVTFVFWLNMVIFINQIHIEANEDLHLAYGDYDKVMETDDYYYIVDSFGHRVRNEPLTVIAMNIIEHIFKIANVKYDKMPLIGADYKPSSYGLRIAEELLGKTVMAVIKEGNGSYLLSASEYNIFE